MGLVCSRVYELWAPVQIILMSRVINAGAAVGRGRTAELGQSIELSPFSPGDKLTAPTR